MNEKRAKKIAQVGKFCVACGTCLKVCPVGAISIPHGITAVIDANRCVGCGKCAKVCPASIIDIVQREITL